MHEGKALVRIVTQLSCGARHLVFKLRAAWEPCHLTAYEPSLTERGESHLHMSTFGPTLGLFSYGLGHLAPLSTCQHPS